MKTYDFIGIGIGPFNLGMAALLDNKSTNGIFFDKKERFDWHPGLMMNWTTLQVPFLADLVTMTDPTSKYSFLNYLQERGRLYKFYFKEKFLIPRQEYNDYCLWVARNCQSCKFGYEVTSIEHIKNSNNETWHITVRNNNGIEKSYYTKNIILGLGTQPSLPPYILNTQNVHHSGEYLDIKNQALKDDHITILGSGQSAGEIFLDLINSKQNNTKISWVTRSKGFFPMEYSKLGLEHFSPEYIDHFYSLTEAKRSQLLIEQDLLYKGISAETISDIYDILYQEDINNNNNAELISNSELQNIAGNKNQLDCEFYHAQQSKSFSIKTNRIIAATGYKANIDSAIANIEHLITRDSNSNINISRDYQLITKDTNLNIFVQNAEMHSHGVGTPDLGLGAYRNAVIINKLLKKEVYRIPKNNIFSSFGIPSKYLGPSSQYKTA